MAKLQGNTINIQGIVSEDGTTLLGFSDPSTTGDGVDFPLTGGSGGSGGFSSVPFSTTLAYDGVNKEMIQQAVTGALAFMSSGNTVGTQINLCLVANGTNVPTFASNFKEATGSSGYDNTANVKNYIQTLYTNNRVIYSIFQEVGDTGAIDSTAPTLSSAVVQNATPTTVAVTYSEALDQTSTLNIADWAVSGHTVSAVAYASSTVINLTVDTFVYGEATRTVTYTNNANRVKDLAGNAAATSSATNITNNVAAAPSQVTGLTLGTPTDTTQPLTWTAPSNGGSPITDYLIEYKASSSGTWLTFSDGTSTATSTVVTGLTASTSYDYRVSAINAFGTGAASSTQSGSTTSGASTVFVDFSAFSAGTTETANGSGFNYDVVGTGGYANTPNVLLATDGYFEAIYSGRSSNNVIPALVLSKKTNSVIYSESGKNFGLYIETEGNGSIYKLFAGSGSTFSGNVTAGRIAEVGDILRLERSGTTLSAKVSSDSGASWTTIHNFVGDASGFLLYPTLMVTTTGSALFTLPKGQGLS